MEVVWAVKHFRPYLYGHQCRVVIDHEALKSLLNTPHPSGKLACWGLAIQELDPQILYCRGTKNQNADALSCSPVPRPGVESGGEVAAKDGEGAVNALVRDYPRQEFGAKQDGDPNLQVIKHYLQLPSDEQS